MEEMLKAIGNGILLGKAVKDVHYLSTEFDYFNPKRVKIFSFF
jgi:hypothetical protein